MLNWLAKVCRSVSARHVNEEVQRDVALVRGGGITHQRFMADVCTRYSDTTRAATHLVSVVATLEADGVSSKGPKAHDQAAAFGRAVMNDMARHDPVALRDGLWHSARSFDDAQAAAPLAWIGVTAGYVVGGLALLGVSLVGGVLAGVAVIAATGIVGLGNLVAEGVLWVTVAVTAINLSDVMQTYEASLTREEKALERKLQVIARYNDALGFTQTAPADPHPRALPAARVVLAQ